MVAGVWGVDCVFCGAGGVGAGACVGRGGTNWAGATIAASDRMAAAESAKLLMLVMIIV